MSVRSALRAGRPLPPGIFLVLISVRGSRPQGHSAAGNIRSIEESNDHIRIEPATFRLIVECLNQYATACPRHSSRPNFVIACCWYWHTSLQLTSDFRGPFSNIHEKYLQRCCIFCTMLQVRIYSEITLHHVAQFWNSITLEVPERLKGNLLH
jgi:hypothetical protein